MRTARVTLLLVLGVLSLTALKCPDDKNTKLSPISPTPTPNINVRLDGSQTQITNGATANFTATVTRPAGSGENISGQVELRATADEKPGHSALDVVIATGTLNSTGSNPDLAVASFTVTCKAAPPPLGGRSGTLAGSSADSGRGGRVCTPRIPNPCPAGCAAMPSNVCPVGCPPGGPNACPSGCVLPPPNVCPSGCGSGVVACEDDPVTVVAVFRGVTSAEGLSVLCMPSVGPTTGGPIR